MAAHQPRIGIIGAGIAGLTLARRLHDAGLAVEVIEKSRGLGGRLAARRRDAATYDHGAQYFTARSEAFRAIVAKAEAGGFAAEWSPRETAQTSPQARYVGTPGMSRFVRGLADGLAIANGKTAQDITCDAAGCWHVATAEGDTYGPFETVVAAIPSPQAAALLGPLDPAFTALDAVTMAPCWTAMLAFKTPLDVPFDVWRAEGEAADGPIGWIARNTSKPDREATPDAWVIQAGTRWSIDNLEREKEDACARLADAFASHLGTLVEGVKVPDVTDATAHRWRYARVITPLGQPFLAAEEKSLYAIGDWCIRGRVEAAWESGDTLASHLLANHQP
ncbi:MAG: FAD-dependent oxidoreductase [Pseudomonadota bacterium]